MGSHGRSFSSLAVCVAVVALSYAPCLPDPANRYRVDPDWGRAGLNPAHIIPTRHSLTILAFSSSTILSLTTFHLTILSMRLPGPRLGRAASSASLSWSDPRRGAFRHCAATWPAHFFPILNISCVLYAILPFLQPPLSSSSPVCHLHLYFYLQTTGAPLPRRYHPTTGGLLPYDISRSPPPTSCISHPLLPHSYRVAPATHQTSTCRSRSPVKACRSWPVSWYLGFGRARHAEASLGVSCTGTGTPGNLDLNEPRLARVQK